MLCSIDLSPCRWIVTKDISWSSTFSHPSSCLLQRCRKYNSICFYYNRENLLFEPFTLNKEKKEVIEGWSLLFCSRLTKNNHFFNSFRLTASRKKEGTKQKHQFLETCCFRCAPDGQSVWLVTMYCLHRIKCVINISTARAILNFIFVWHRYRIYEFQGVCMYVCVRVHVCVCAVIFIGLKKLKQCVRILLLTFFSVIHFDITVYNLQVSYFQENERNNYDNLRSISGDGLKKNYTKLHSFKREGWCGWDLLELSVFNFWKSRLLCQLSRKKTPRDVCFVYLTVPQLLWGYSILKLN